MVRSPQTSDTTLHYLWNEEDGDGRILKLAIAGGLLVHALIFAIRLPELRLDSFVENQPELFLITPTRFTPPVDIPREVLQHRKRRIPIPDPTPEAPEPLISTQTLAPAIEIPVDVVLANIPAPPAPDSAGPIMFRTEMNRPVRISGIDPTYTEVARHAHVEGVVVLQAVIDKTGAIKAIEVLKPLPFGLDDAAVQAVGTWRFTPATLDDRPIDVIYNLTVRFGIQ